MKQLQDMQYLSHSTSLAFKTVLKTHTYKPYPPPPLLLTFLLCACVCVCARMCMHACVCVHVCICACMRPLGAQDTDQWISAQLRLIIVRSQVPSLTGEVGEHSPTVNFLCYYSGIHSTSYYYGSWNRPLSICKKRRDQVTDKHANTSLSQQSPSVQT